MLTPLSGLIKRVEFVKDNFTQIVMTVLVDSEGQIIELNQEQLYDKGEASTGKSIVPKYRAYTIARKKAKGQPYDRVTLKDTGDVYDSMFVFYDGDKFFIEADDPKIPKLVKKYGDDFLGLTNDSGDKLIEIIRGPLLDNLKKKLYDS